MSTTQNRPFSVASFVLFVSSWFLFSGCSLNDDNRASSVESTTINNSGVNLPTNATELADGIYLYQDGQGNRLTYDSQTGETRPLTVLVQSGTDNVLTVYIANPPPPELPEATP
jgi:hypothetical protein